MSSSKRRVAYILQDFHIGGMESLIYRIARRLTDHYDVYFIASHVPDILPLFSEIGTAVYIGQDWLKLARYLQQERIDLVQYGNVRAYADAALAAGVPVIIERTDGLRRGVALQSKAGLSAVIASTRGTVDPIARLIPRERIHLIYNGIDLQDLDCQPVDRLGCGDEAILIGRVSRFGPGKNLEMLIEAVRQLAPRYPQVRLALVGDNSRIPGTPDVMSELRARAKGLEEQVIFTGHVENPIPLVKGFDIGTCVSRQGNEGIPNSLIESMAARRPVVATRVDDIPELVEDQVNGILIDDGDLTQLVAALERLIQDADLRRRMGEVGRRRVETDFNLDQQAEAYQQLYDHLLAHQPPPAAIWLRRQQYAIGLLMQAGWERFGPTWLKTLAHRVRGKLWSLSQRIQ